VAALPRIIKTLRSRGYRMVTVSKLLGQRTIWGTAPKLKSPLTPRSFLESPAGRVPPTPHPE
jgi:hypothetical protein